MLKNALTRTFIHLPGIGPATERGLWAAGVEDWDALSDALRSGLRPRNIPPHGAWRTRPLWEEILPEPDRESSDLLRGLLESRRALDAADLGHFLARLRPNQHWRVLAPFIEDALYLDIETTGLSRELHYMTVVGALYRGDFHQWTWREDLTALGALLRAAPLVVTYNGRRFDLPFLRTQARSLPNPRAHVDMLPIAQSRKYRGGQKDLEVELGLERPGLVADLDGREAVQLWAGALSGNRDAWEQLLLYNKTDVLQLQRIAYTLCAACTQSMARPPDTSPGPELDADRAHSRAFERLQSEWQTSRVVVDSLLSAVETTSGGSAAVVGIDLRGNPERPTGFAVCTGATAWTSIVHSDEEIMAATLAARPDLVSIDAPLFLPRGRHSVSDDSPCRVTGGIIRDAERILFSRGIRVYPALIRHMQGLTKRGIELTELLTRHGIPVIESYPGAAQDILGIPRKRAGPDLLERGLLEFGIRIDGGKTHDELDAVTSALVGYFYLAGQYEGIGAEDEGFMIIPRLSDRMRWEPPPRPTVLCLLGLPGSGKTTLARALANGSGASALYVGEVLRTMARQERNLARILSDGGPAPEPLVEEIVRSSFRPPLSPVVVDGFPRHRRQLPLANEALSPWLAVHLEISPELCIERIRSRTPHPSSSRPEDLSPRALGKRFATAQKQLAELTDQLRPTQILRVDASLPIDQLVKQVKAAGVGY